jgi:hypothetical protein
VSGYGKRTAAPRRREELSDTATALRKPSIAAQPAVNARIASPRHRASAPRLKAAPRKDAKNGQIHFIIEKISDLS